MGPMMKIKMIARAMTQKTAKLIDFWLSVYLFSLEVIFKALERWGRCRNLVFQIDIGYFCNTGVLIVVTDFTF